MNSHSSTGGRLRRSAALLSVSALAATALISTGSPASAALTESADDNAHGTPMYFADSEGLALQLCEAACAEVGVPFDPAHAVYFSAAAEIAGISAGFEVATVAVEDDLGNPTGEVGVVNSALFRGEGLTPNAVYTLTGPWGAETCTADAAGDLDNKNCLFESGGETGSVLDGPVKTFLRTPGAPAGTIGDHETIGAVTGSPTGFNRFSVSGPGLNESTDQFSLMGQMVDDQPMSSVSSALVDFGNVAGATTKSLTYSSFGTASATPDVSSDNAAFTAAGCAAPVASGNSCQIDVTYTPTAGQSATGTLTIADNSFAAPRTVALSGSSLPVAGLSSSSLTLPNRNPATGPSAVREIQVLNTGAAPMTVGAVTSSSSEFRVSDTCATVAAGTSCAVRVQFAPRTLGLRSATLNIVTDGGNLSVALSGRGVDTIRPAVTARTPAAGASAVGRASNVAVRFGESVRGVRSSTFTLVNSRTGNRVGAVVSGAGNRWVLNPRNSLAPRTRYTVRLAGGPAAIRDLSNNQGRTTTWSFRTR